MKRVLLSSSLLLSMLFCSAQSGEHPFPKTISVTGAAEMELVPDQIYLGVELKEYQKKGSEKVTIETIRTNFLAACRKTGIPDSCISVDSYDGNNRNYWKRKQTTLFNEVTYQLKFSAAEAIDRFVDLLGDEGVENIFLIRTNHSRMPEYRKQLKIAAIKAAREKADYLAEAIGENAAQAITITEPSENDWNIFSSWRSGNAYSNAQVAYDQSNEAGQDFKKIKLRYEVTVVFALK